MNKIYPRPHDKHTVYLKDVITKQNISAIQSGDIDAPESAE